MAKEKMQEAEVSIRTALFYIKSGLTNEDVEVAIDGAQVRTGKTIHFDIDGFIQQIGLIKEISIDDSWRGKYRINGFKPRIIIHSYPGKGDIVVKQNNDRILYIESKKGNVVKCKGSKEYQLMREAIGQLMTTESYSNKVDLAVAVPKSDKSYELAQRWSRLEQMRLFKITFLLVEDDGNVLII